MSRQDELVALEPDAADLQPRFEPFVEALVREFGMAQEDALATVRVVADAFGDAEEVDDEALDSEVRSIFYTLESKDLLTFRRETFQSEEGQTLRAYFWSICHAELRRYADQVPDENSEPGVYDRLPGDVWSGRNT